VDPTSVATALAGMRLGVGAGLLLTPRLGRRVWVGRHATRPGVRAVGRALGVRDAALATATLVALAGGKPAGAWVRAGAAADGIDAVAHALVARHLSPARRLLWPVGAGACAAIGWWAGSSLD
jgi:hypothetical protein